MVKKSLHSRLRLYLYLIPQKIISMPSLVDWFGTSATNAWDNFFSNFNYQWVLVKLPNWSFDVSHITSVWDNFFSNFNKEWSITALPGWSFDTSNITIAGSYFFSNFNKEWSITALPGESFDMSNIIMLSILHDIHLIRMYQIW